MKKILLLVLSIILAISFIACENESPQVKISLVDENNSVILTKEVIKGSDYALPTAPERKGYTFDGWYIGENKCDSTIKVDADLIIVATYLPNIKVTINFNNGEENLVVEIPKGHSYSLPTTAPKKDGYSFEGMVYREYKVWL